MKKIKNQVNIEPLENHGRRSFLKSAAVGVMGIAGLGFSDTLYSAGEKKLKFR